jgi:CHAT domain-containing protein
MRLIQEIIGGGLLIMVGLTTGCHQSSSRQLIHVGERREDVLGESGSIRTAPPRGPERYWLFDGQAGQKLTITAESYECNTFLILADALGRQIAWGDDNGRFFNAWIHTTLPATGRYRVIVGGADADQTGTYWLSLEEGYQEADWSESSVLAYYQRGLKWAEDQNRGRAVCWLNLNLGRYYRERRQWERAEQCYAKSLAAAQSINFLYGQWAAALERGRVLTRRMRFDQAVSQLQKAVELSKKLRAADETAALLSIQFGDLYDYMGKADLAKFHYQNATECAQRSGLPSTRVRLYTSLSAFFRRRDEGKATEYAKQAYALREGVDPVLEVKASHMQAGTLMFLIPGKTEEGLRLAAEARRKVHQLGCLDDEVSILTTMSLAHFKLNNIDETVHLAREAVQLTSLGDEDPTPRRIALQMQAEGEKLRGNHEAALQLCLKAMQTLEGAWAREPIEELREDFLSQLNAICTQIVLNLHALNARHPSSEYARQAFDFVERSRSRSLLNQLASMQGQTRVAQTPRLFDLDHQLLEKISALERELVLVRTQGPTRRDLLFHLQEERSTLMAERMRLQAEIRQAGRNEYHTAQLIPLTAKQAQQDFLANHPNRVILDYQLGIQASFLIILTPRQVRLLKLPDRATISKAINEWWAHISYQLNVGPPSLKALNDYLQSAHRLYDMLVKPAAPFIGGRDLIIVPSDAIYDLAFEALVVDGPGRQGRFKRPHYLVEDHAVTYAPSVSVLAEIEHRPDSARPSREVLLIGDPVFNHRDPEIIPTKQGDANRPAAGALNARQQTDTGLARLPATRQEVLEIGHLAEKNHFKPTVWLGLQANEENIKDRPLSSYRFIHLATHAVVDYQDSEFSALILSPSPKPGSEDGILTTREVAELKLNADLVVLSGCETITGQRTQAEGILGLRRAFIIAGARRVCGSLWPVEDTWTKKLMSAFYKGLFGKGLTSPAALQRAKIILLRAGTAPSQWAPFILIGSAR